MATRVNFLDRFPDKAFPILNALLPSEDPIGLARPLIRDHSIYDLQVDLSIGQQNGVQGMASRCVLGWSGVDKSFPGLWSQAGDLDDYFRTSYGVLYPSLSVSRFCEHWFNHHPTIDVIPRVLDAELQDGQPDAVVGEKILDACEIIKEYDGVYPIIYSRYLLLNKWLRYWNQEDIEKMYYWGARYLWDRTREHPGPPYDKNRMIYVNIPEENWIIHQTADKKAPFPGETQRSTIVDWDRWELGTVEQMWDWIADKWGGEEPPTPTDPELEERVEKLEQDVVALREDLDSHDHSGSTEPIDPTETIQVQATDNFSLHIVYDYNDEGKPKMTTPDVTDPSRVYVKTNDILNVLAHAWHSKGDLQETPVIIADGGTKYYIDSVSGQFARKDKVKKI